MFPPDDLPAPTAECLWLTCDDDDERWRLDLTTAAWTGGAELLWTADGAWVEAHPVRSISAAPDGSDDILSLTLDQVGDWRQALPGSSTALYCSDAPASLTVVYDPEGRVADCVWRGDRTLWDTVDGLPDCPRESTALCRPPG